MFVLADGGLFGLNATEQPAEQTVVLGDALGGLLAATGQVFDNAEGIVDAGTVKVLGFVKAVEVRDE